MENHFAKLTDRDSFDRLVEKSKERPVVIFKHSLSCSISASVYDQLLEFDGEIMLLEVQRNRELSKEIENRLGVEHESPQVIVLRNGQVVWDASHFSVTPDAVAKALQAAEACSEQ